MNDDILKLQQENERLSRLVERDWLTGLYNRGAIEAKVNRLLEDIHAGVMLIIDLDYFKQINDRYGHITGDQVLQEIGKTLRALVPDKDIVARIGGDEFAIYMPIERKLQFAEDCGRLIKARIASVSFQSNPAIRITICFGHTIYKEGDDYQSLLDRADQKLLEQKKARKRRGERKVQSLGNGINMDIRRIREELSENDSVQGAYCQDYETFKGIYRFIERRLQRTKNPAYTILFTLTDGKGDLPSFWEREVKINLLREKIQGCLRLGDVFTQYSSGQFLVVISDVTEETAEMIAIRIQDAFYEELANYSEKLLLHYCYPLMPAGTFADKN